MQKFDKYIQIGMIGFICFVFIQSLFFKYTNSPETVYIFQDRLNPWAYGLTGFNLFAQNGIFSQYVIGTCEGITSLILLASFTARFFWARALGGLGVIALMGGAASFHLFTPLGVSVQNADGTYDGGLLFGMACANLLFGIYLVYKNHRMLKAKLLG